MSFPRTQSPWTTSNCSLTWHCTRTRWSCCKVSAVIRQTLIVAWGSAYEGDTLTYAEPGHAEYRRDVRFGLEPEWVAVALLGLVYAGEITLALPGRKIDAGNLEEATKVGIADLVNWKFIERPKELPLVALTELFQLLELPTGLIKDANQHTLAIGQLQKRVADELDRLVMTRKQDTLRRLWEPHPHGQMPDLPYLDTVIRYAAMSRQGVSFMLGGCRDH